MNTNTYPGPRPFVKRLPARAAKKNRKILWCSLLLMLTIIMASFRAPNAESLMLDYSVSGPIATIQKLSLYIVGASMVLFIFLLPDKNPLLRKPVVSRLLIFYFIFQLINILTSFYYLGDFNGFVVDLIFLCVIAWFFGLAVKRFTFDLDSRGSIFRYFYLGLIAFVIINFVVEYGGLGNTIWKGRMQGVTGHPNFLGLCAGLSVVCSFSLLLASPVKKLKIFYGLAMVMSTVLVFLTLSRTAMVASIAGCGIVLNCHITNISTRIILFLVGLVMVVVIFSVGLESLDYADRGNTREGTWKKLGAVVSTVPILGQDPATLPTSNSYLFAFASTGLFGFAFFIIAIFGMLRKSIYIAFSYSLDKGKKVQYSAIAGMGVFLCIAGVFEGLLVDAGSISVLALWAVLSFSTDIKTSKRARLVPVKARPFAT